MENNYLEGRLTEERLIEKVLNGEIKYVTICFPITHTVCYLRHEAKYFIKHTLNGKCKYCGYMYVESFGNIPIEAKFEKDSSGWGDYYYKIDKESIRIQSWLGEEYAICMAIHVDEKSQNLEFAPRNLLLNQIDTLYKELNFKCKAASELEFYIFNNKNEQITKNYPEFNLSKSISSSRRSDLVLGISMDNNEEFTRKIKDKVISCGIELEGMNAEGGPGQHEINFRYCNLLENCDNHIYFKQCLKHIMHKEGMGCTFMAKPFAEHPGSSFHIHLSLYDDNGFNIFSPSAKDSCEINIGSGKSINCSSTLLYVIGGIIRYLPDLFLVFAPFVNSYKRFKKYSFAPYYIDTWGYESRYPAIRLIGEEENLHIEVRIGAADGNPYIVFTALLAMAMEGVKNKIMPPEITIGDFFNSTDRTTAPKNLKEGIKLFEQSEFAKKVYGKDYAEFLVNFAKNEWNLYEDHVSNFEINRYIDLV